MAENAQTFFWALFFESVCAKVAHWVESEDSQSRRSLSLGTTPECRGKKEDSASTQTHRNIVCPHTTFPNLLRHSPPLASESQRFREILWKTRPPHVSPPSRGYSLHWGSRSDRRRWGRIEIGSKWVRNRFSKPNRDRIDFGLIPDRNRIRIGGGDRNQIEARGGLGFEIGSRRIRIGGGGIEIRSRLGGVGFEIGSKCHVGFLAGGGVSESNFWQVSSFRSVVARRGKTPQAPNPKTLVWLRGSDRCVPLAATKKCFAKHTGQHRQLGIGRFSNSFLGSHGTCEPLSKPITRILQKCHQRTFPQSVFQQIPFFAPGRFHERRQQSRPLAVFGGGFGWTIPPQHPPRMGTSFTEDQFVAPRRPSEYWAREFPTKSAPKATNIVACAATPYRATLQKHLSKNWKLRKPKWKMQKRGHWDKSS